MREIVLSTQEIDELTTRIGNGISEEVKNEPLVPVFLCVLKGSVNFMTDLTKKVTCPIYIDYIQISSYMGAHSTGEIRLLKDPTILLKDRVVVIVEDIIDSGLSMKYLLNHIKKQYQPKKIIVVTLIYKKNACKVPDLQINYIGKELDSDKFLIGYGLDYDQINRNIPYVYVPDKEEFEKLKDLTENH